ncbi:hypothetical protein ACOMHN_043398 [Nucella lapillus]
MHGVQGSGHLQVGFFLYEFRHDPTTLSAADITGLPLPPLPHPSPSNLTSSPPSEVQQVIGDVSPWGVRTLLPNEESRGGGGGFFRGIFEEDLLRPGGGEGKEQGDGRDASLWRESSPCNETSSPRPQYQFLLCLDYIYSQANGVPCRLGKVELNTLSYLGGRDLVTFPSTLGVTSNGSVTSNPIVFGFDSWKVNLFLGGLVLSLMLQCDKDFYGRRCDAFCRITAPDSEHTFCNVTSGRKQCMPGWEGPGCRTDVDECSQGYCQNGAHCINSPPGFFTCQCPLGFVGRRCQRRAPVCHTIPCKNGGSCHDTQFGFVCFCRYGYAGYRCERILHFKTRNLTVSDSLNVGKTTGSDDHYFAISWESWYSALVIGGFFFIVLVVIICCLLRGRLFRGGIRAEGSFHSLLTVVVVVTAEKAAALLSCTSPTSSYFRFRCGITANGSFYSLFIATKTNDDRDPQPDQRSDAVDNDVDVHTYQNIFSVTGKQSYPSLMAHRRSHDDTSRTAGTDDFSVRYLAHVPSCRHSSLQDACHYANMGTSFTSDGHEDLEGLPNLVDPRRSPLMVNRDLLPEAGVAERKRVPNRRRPLSDKAEIPKLTVTQHFKSSTSASYCDASNSVSSDSPESLRKESRVKATTSRKSIIIGRAREVYTIGGSLSAEDVSGATTPKPAVRKSILGAIPGRKKGSQPRLCSIRRMDSGGYEIPLKYQDTASIRNQYASLRHIRMDEHVYNELRCPTPDPGTMGRRKLGDLRFQQPAPRGKHRNVSPFLTIDQRTNQFSETACYVDLTEHIPENAAFEEDSGSEDNVLTKNVDQNQEECASHTHEATSEVSSAGTKRKARVEKPRIPTVQRYKKTRRQLSQRPLTQEGVLREIRLAGSDNPAFEEGRSTHVLTLEEDDDSDDVEYEELYSADTDDDDMCSDCDYKDVFTKTNAAV